MCPPTRSSPRPNETAPIRSTRPVRSSPTGPHPAGRGNGAPSKPSSPNTTWRTRRWPGSRGSSTPPTSPPTWTPTRSAPGCWPSAPADSTWNRRPDAVGPRHVRLRRAVRLVRAPGRRTRRAAGMTESPAPAPKKGAEAPQDATQAPQEGTDAGQQPSEPETACPPGFGSFVRYFLGLGTWGFGGPIATVGYMQRDLVERRHWMTRADFLDGVALGQTMPGPLAAQVAMWVGYLRRGTFGALAVAAAFIMPSFLLVLTVAAIYRRYSGLPIVQALFYGIAPVVVAIIAVAAWKLAKLTNKGDKRLWAISATLLLVTAITGAEIAYLFIAAGLFMLLWDAPPRRLLPRRANPPGRPTEPPAASAL